MRDSKGRFCKALKVGDRVDATYYSEDRDAHTCMGGLIVEIDESDPKFPYRFEADWFITGIRYAFWCLNEYVKRNTSETEEIHACMSISILRIISSINPIPNIQRLAESTLAVSHASS